MKITFTCVTQFIGLAILFRTIYGQYRGKPCELGIYTYTNDCSFALDQLRNGIRPNIAGYENQISIVCCPNKNEDEPIPLNKRKSTDYCESLKKQFQQNTRLVSIEGIIGGVQSSAREIPHMAALGYGEEADKQWLCSGTLITKNFVLTAAHCFQISGYGAVSYVRLGDSDLKSLTDDAQPQDFKVIKKHIHQNYTPQLKYNDIGLLQLDRPAYFDIYVKPACLHTSIILPQDLPIAAGWGNLNFTTENSKLMKVTLVYYTNQQCSQSFRNQFRETLPNGIDENTQICAGGDKDEVKDTCQGDSGGPLQILTSKDPIQYHIVGITSFGTVCGTKNTPGVYTRVSNYIQWIEDIVWPNS